MINLGAKWRVGDGKRIQIYGDRWILGEGSGKVLSPINLLPTDAQVAELINPVSGWWGQQIIDSNFLPFEALRIKAIPISSIAREDTFIWSKSSDGVYLVKSGYKALCEESQREAASGSSSGVGKNQWSGVWKLKVPGKVKQFMWRACSESLPTKLNLWRRKIVACPKCEVCNSQPENTLHVLWDCEETRAVWDRDFMWFDRRKVAKGSFMDLWEMLDSRPEMKELFAVTAWQLWTRRNKLRLNQNTSQLQQIPGDS